MPPPSAISALAPVRRTCMHWSSGRQPGPPSSEVERTTGHRQFDRLTAGLQEAHDARHKLTAGCWRSRYFVILKPTHNWLLAAGSRMIFRWSRCSERDPLPLLLQGTWLPPAAVPQEPLQQQCPRSSKELIAEAATYRFAVKQRSCLRSMCSRGARSPAWTPARLHSA